MLTRSKQFIAIPLCLHLTGLLLLSAPQKSNIDKVLDSLFAVHDFSEVAISPDGRRVAWVESKKDGSGAPSPNSGIYVADLRFPSRPPFRVSGGEEAAFSEHDLAWSPDSGRLAFLSDKGMEGQLQLFVAELPMEDQRRSSVRVDLDAGPHRLSKGSPRKLSNLTGFLASPRWSPDGRQIALLFTENAPRTAGPLGPTTPLAGLIDDAVYEQRLTLIDTHSAEARVISPPDLYVYEYDWSPDSKGIVATAAHGAGDANWYVAGLYTLDVVAGTMRQILKPPYQLPIAVPRWSQDGRSIAFIGGLMSDEGNIGGDVFVIPAAGGQPRNLTPGIKASPSWITWLYSGQILFAEQIEGASGLATLNPADGAIHTLWTGMESNSTGGWSFGVSMAGDGKTCALILQSFSQPPEIWAGPIGVWKQVTSRNRNAAPAWGKAENLHWSNEGMEIQGWLIYPSDYDPSRRYPLVVSVHGGPGGMVRPSWPGTFFDFTLLSHEGYFVLFPNPRGSLGFGQAYSKANFKDFGYGDLRDILAGVDEVVKKFPVDSNRVGIGGWSYGGFMSMWAVTQTPRFRAAVAGAGIVNWQSYYGQNDIGQWMIPFFGASVYDDPAVYAKSAPINFIKNVKTPTLVLVGDRDGECPLPQSLEFHRALKTLGVKTQLVVYPNEGHLISRPDHRRDILQRTLAWFNDNLR